MKRSTIAVAGAIVLALIGGGTAAAITLNGQEPAPEASATSTPAPSQTDAPAAAGTTPPLVAETPTPLRGEDAEAAYLLEVRSRLAKIQTQIPNATDEQLIAVAYEACERITGGESSEGMSVIEGEEISTHGYYMDSGSIITSARLTLCPPVKE